MIQMCCMDSRGYALVFWDATDVENWKTENVEVDVGDLKDDVS